MQGQWACCPYRELLGGCACGHGTLDNCTCPSIEWFCSCQCPYCMGPRLLRKVHAGHKDCNVLLVLDWFWALIYGHLHTKSIWNLKQAPKMRISQNQCYFPIFLPRFWGFGQALKTSTSIKGLVMSALHCSRNCCLGNRHNKEHYIYYNYIKETNTSHAVEYINGDWFKISYNQDRKFYIKTALRL